MQTTTDHNRSQSIQQQAKHLSADFTNSADFTVQQLVVSDLA